MELPDQYGQVEYVENPSTAYINVGIAPNQNFRVDCEFLVTEYAASAHQYLFGPFEANLRFFYAPLDTGNENSRFGYGNTYKTFTPFPTADTKYKASLNKNVFTLYNSSGGVIGTDSIAANNFQSNLNLCIFSSDPGSSSYPTKAKVYSYKAWNNTTPIRDMIPAYHYATTTYGLYDLLNDVFYSSDNSSVAFIGPPAPPIKNLYLLKIPRRDRFPGPI